MTPFSSFQAFLAIVAVLGFAYALLLEWRRRRYYRRAFLVEAPALGLVAPDRRGVQAAAGEELAALGLFPRFGERRGLAPRHRAMRESGIAVIDALVAAPGTLPPRLVGGSAIAGWDERRLAEIGRARLVAALAQGRGGPRGE